jgi:hypothetical protein
VPPKLAQCVLALAGQPQTMLDMGARTANQFIVGLLHRNGKVESAEREIIFLGNKLRQSESLNEST